MYTGLLLVMLAAAPAADLEPKLTIFADEPWYQAVRGDEEAFAGVLERLPPRQRGRNAFVLVMNHQGRQVTREVFVAGNDRALLPYAGQRVTLTGTAVDLRIDGRVRQEIWPARLTLGRAAAGRGRMEVLAQTPWSAKFDKARIRVGAGQEQLVLRGPEDLLLAAGGDRGEAVNIIRSLGVGDIDWDTQMMLVITGGVQPNNGYSVELLGLDVRERTLMVRWRVKGPRRGDVLVARFNNPALVLLVPQFDGRVVFDPPPKR